GHRPVLQISRNTHRFIYNNLVKRAGSLSELPKIRKIHRNQPIEGVIELTATLAFRARVRALIARFEGVDGKWLCTEFELI
ncbi:MAG: Rv3235 family protein, partial [Actinomycetota bacterium]